MSGHTLHLPATDLYLTDSQFETLEREWNRINEFRGNHGMAPITLAEAFVNLALDAILCLRCADIGSVEAPAPAPSTGAEIDDKPLPDWLTDEAAFKADCAAVELLEDLLEELGRGLGGPRCG